MNGFLLVDKSMFSTSFNMVSLCRKVFQQTKVGHSGTLDPFATGLLVVALGEALKLLEYLPAEPKEYTGTAVLGATSSTFDREGEKVAGSLNTKVDLELINKIIQEKFVGKILQVPPAHSAIKVRGVPAYVRARRGEELSMAARPATIFSYEADNLLPSTPESDGLPIFDFRASVSSGTYIRSLIHDLGQELCTGAYINSLRRVRIGPFFIQDAVTVPELESFLGDDRRHISARQQAISSPVSVPPLLAARVLPLEVAVSHLPRRELTEGEYRDLSNGLYVGRGEIFNYSEASSVLAAFFQNRLVGILEYVGSNQLKFHKKLNIDIS